jgi:hypothetical protein
MKRTVAIAILLSALLAGCAPATAPSGGASATPVASASPNPSASPSSSSSAAAATASPGSPAPEPTADLPPFACDLPATLPATVDRAQIVDVRVGSHGSGASGYDRMVFEFQGPGIPEVTLRAGTPPFTQDPSGLPLAVRGSSFLVLVLQGATGITPEGTTTYNGPTTFTPGFPALTEFKQAGDFEAVSEWVAGLTGPSCHRLLVLQSPTRLVIDVQHPQG